MMEINPVTYRGKAIDRGVILGSRPWRWTLKKKYSPCWAKINGKFASELSPHRKNFLIYIPEHELHAGDRLEIFDRPYQGPEIRRILEVQHVGTHHIETRTIKEEQRDARPQLNTRGQEDAYAIPDGITARVF